VELKDLEIYKICLEISCCAWLIYKKLPWREKKIVGDQWIKAIDSIGANIAEGFGRFHYLDKNKFNYNARGSLLESIHWTQLLKERRIITEKEGDEFLQKLESLLPRLNAYIGITRNKNKNEITNY
jgi:four helix bundle protein